MVPALSICAIRHVYISARSLRSDIHFLHSKSKESVYRLVNIHQDPCHCKSLEHTSHNFEHTTLKARHTTLNTRHITRNSRQMTLNMRRTTLNTRHTTVTTRCQQIHDSLRSLKPVLIFYAHWRNWSFSRVFRRTSRSSATTTTLLFLSLFILNA